MTKAVMFLFVNQINPRLLVSVTNRSKHTVGPKHEFLIAASSGKANTFFNETGLRLPGLLRGDQLLPVGLQQIHGQRGRQIIKNLNFDAKTDEILADLGKEFGIDFGKKCMPLGEIKKILGDVKKE